jgi:acyl-CoA thioester hydrolase
MNQIGIDFRDVEAMGIVVPVVSVSCQYKHVTRFGDDVAVTAALKLYNGIRFAFTYEVRDVHTGELNATGESEHCFLKGDRVVNLRRSAPELHQRFSEAM